VGRGRGGVWARLRVVFPGGSARSPGFVPSLLGVVIVRWPAFLVSQMLGSCRFYFPGAYVWSSGSVFLSLGVVHWSAAFVFWMPVWGGGRGGAWACLPVASSGRFAQSSGYVLFPPGDVCWPVVPIS
jgi:hypothetical protein